jgi:large subunit ribosomal protein L6
MSRIGKREITIPSGTEVSVAGNSVTVKGKAGTISRAVHPAVAISVSGNAISVAPVEKTRLARALWGTYAAHMRNMVAGVNQPFVKKLEVQGIGYRAELSGKQIKLSVGFSHPILVSIPEGITAAVDKNVITISGVNKDTVGAICR